MPSLSATNTVVIATNNPEDVATNDRSVNRRDKASFKAYQREYMRKRRAAQKEKQNGQ